MADRMVISVEIDDDLGGYVADTVGEDGRYETIGDYVRDLIRQDQEQASARFEACKAELQEAFARPDSDYVEFDVEAFLARMKQRDRPCAA